VADGFLPSFGVEQLEDDIMDGNYDQKSWASAYDHTVETPEGYWVEKIEGKIPVELEGTYFRNGPGEFNFLNEPVAFPFDANGIVGSVAIKDGKAFFRSRFVKTKESLMEERAGRRLFKGAFGTIPKNGVSPFRLFTNRNAASGKTFLGNGKLYAPYEGAPLTELDPVTLDTLHPTLPDNLLSQALDMALQALPYVVNPQLGVSSESSGFLNTRTVRGFGDNKYDARRKVTICHNYRPIPKIGSTSLSTEFNFFEIGDDLKIHAQQSYIVDNFSTAHSIGVSENYYIINKFPTSIDFTKALDPNAGLISCIEWDNNGTHEFHLVPRPAHNSQNGAERKPLVFQMPETTFLNHFVNAFEEGDKIIIDALHYEKYLNGITRANTSSYKDRNSKDDPGPRWRRTICSLNGEVETREISTRSVELTSINPHFLGRRYQYVYMLSGLHPFMNLEPQAISKVNLETGEMETWTKGPFYYAAEPLFVPRPGFTKEDDGWVMSFCYNGQTNKTEFVILDAQNIKRGPIAILYLNQSIGHGFHGHWTDAFFGPQP